MKECPRCGKQAPKEGAFCSYCGAPLLEEPAKKDLKKASLSGKQLRVFTLLLGLCALLLAGVVILLVDGQNIIGSVPTQMPAITAVPYASPTPSPSPTPEPPKWHELLGKWSASRVDVNKNKVKPIVQTEYLHGMQVEFIEGGTAYIRLPRPGQPDIIAERPYSVEGDSFYIEYGTEVFDDVEYYGRTRYFIKNDTLVSVYLLDGREASDYMIFSLVDDAILPGTTAESERSAED